MVQVKLSFIKYEHLGSWFASRLFKTVACLLLFTFEGKKTVDIQTYFPRNVKKKKNRQRKST